MGLFPLLTILLFLPGFQYPLPFRELQENGASQEITDSSQATGTEVEYQNLTADRQPVLGYPRDVAQCQGNYMNSEEARNRWYENLCVDESDRFVSTPYKKLITPPQNDSPRRKVGKSSDTTCDTTERSPIMSLRTEFENMSMK